MKEQARFKYKSRNYTAIVVKGEILIVKAATRRFYESQPTPIGMFMPEVQLRAREALNA